MQQHIERFFQSVYRFTCNLTQYIKLPAYVRTSCWSAKSILMSVRHCFINFLQIRRYKANDDSRSQFCHFVDNASKQKTRLNHFRLKSFVDWFSFTKRREFTHKKTYHRFSLFRIKSKSLNTSYKILMLFINMESEFNFYVRKNILFSQHLLRKHRRFSCPSNTK